MKTKEDLQQEIETELANNQLITAKKHRTIEHSLLNESFGVEENIIEELTPISSGLFSNVVATFTRANGVKQLKLVITFAQNANVGNQNVFNVSEVLYDLIKPLSGEVLLKGTIISMATVNDSGMGLRLKQTKQFSLYGMYQKNSTYTFSLIYI